MELSSSASKSSPLYQHPDSRNASVRSVGTNLSGSEGLPARTPALARRIAARVEVGCLEI